MIVDSGTGSKLIKDTGSGSRITRDYLTSEIFAIVPTAAFNVLAGAISTMPVIKDAELNEYTTTVVRAWQNLNVTIPSDGFATGPAIFTSDNVDLPVNSSGVITPIADGTATISVEVPGLGLQKNNGHGIDVRGSDDEYFHGIYYRQSLESISWIL